MWEVVDFRSNCQRKDFDSCGGKDPAQLEVQINDLITINKVQRVIIASSMNVLRFLDGEGTDWRGPVSEEVGLEGADWRLLGCDQEVM